MLNPDVITPPNNSAPINKIIIEITKPIQTANKFIWLLIRLIIFLLSPKLSPHFLQNCASALLSEPHLVQIRIKPPKIFPNIIINAKICHILLLYIY